MRAMPILSTIALERLLEPSTRNSSTPPPEPQKDKYDGNHNTENGSSAVPVKRPSRRIFISPALYATPKPTPIPGSPTCVSPSPYVINHKHRRPPTDEAASRHNGFQVPPSQNPHFNAEDPANSKHRFSTDSPSIELKKNKKKLGEEIGEKEVEGEMMGGISFEHMEGLVVERDEDVEGSMSVDTTCSSDMGDGGSLGRGGSFGRLTLLSSLTEFYDAAEEFISDSSTSQSPSLSMKFETELHSMRLNLLEEIERRKKSEETLGHMQNYWRGIIKHLTPLGISFPKTFLDENTPFDKNSDEQIFQKLAVTKFISEAIRKAEACAEIEAIIDAKNHEIVRLRDRLQRCEDVNHEMSQRNQEIVELNRQKRRRRKARQRWIWSCIGLSITIGASIIAFSYLPHSGRILPSTPDHVADVTTAMIEESGSSDPVM